MKWISVLGELPEIGEKVAIWSPKHWVEAYRFPSLNGDWCWYSDGYNYLQEEVAHWMRLEEPK